MRRYLIWLTVLGLFTLPVQSWHIPHALTALGVVAAIAIKFAKSWNWQHWGTLAGAVAVSRGFHLAQVRGARLSDRGHTNPRARTPRVASDLPDTPFEGVIPMLTGLAKLIAHSLFALRRSGASVLSLIVVTTVATAFATVGAATLLDGRRVR